MAQIATQVPAAMVKNASPSTPELPRQVLSASETSFDVHSSRTPPRVRSPSVHSSMPHEPESIRQKHLAAKAKAKRRYSQYQANVMRHPGPMPSPFFTFQVDSCVVKKPRVSAPSTMSPFLQVYPQSDATHKAYGMTKSSINPSKHPLKPVSLPSSDDLSTVTLAMQNDDDDEMMQLDDDEPSAYQPEDPFNY